MSKSRGLVFLYIAITTIALVLCAIWNGFPLLYADTSTYLHSGWALETPFDRPIMYGLFIRLASLNFHSIWMVIILQAFLFVIETYWLYKNLLDKEPGGYFYGSICLLGILTPLSWTVSQLMPDIFMAILVLALLNMLWEKSRSMKYLHYLIFLVAVASHLSHISFALGLLVLLFFVGLISSPLKALGFKNRVLLHAFLLVVLALSTMGKALSSSKHVFLAGAMAERGVLQEFLKDKCPNASFELCAYIEDIPDVGWQFVWEEDSPLYKIGGWKESKEELTSIIEQSLVEPKYLGLQISSTFRSFLRQMYTFDIGDGNGRFDDQSLLAKRLLAYFPDVTVAFHQSKQNTTGIENLGDYIVLHNWVIGLSTVILVYFIIFSRSFKPRLRLLLLIFLTALCYNAFLSAAFANVIDRLGSKMIFFIPFALVFMESPWRSKKKLHPIEDVAH
jgi:hypothetical protein